MGFWKCEACKPNHWCKHSGELVPLRCAVNACLYSDWQPAEPDNELAVKQQRIDWCEELQGALRRRIAQLESQPDKLDELAAALERLASIYGEQVVLRVLSDGGFSVRRACKDRYDNVDPIVLGENPWRKHVCRKVNSWCDEHEQTPEQIQAEQDAEDVAALKDVSKCMSHKDRKRISARLESLTGGPK